MSQEARSLQVALAIVEAAQPEGAVALNRERICPICKKPGNGPYLRNNKQVNSKTYRYPGMFHRRERKPRWCTFNRQFMSNAVKQLPAGALGPQSSPTRKRASVRPQAERPSTEAVAEPAAVPKFDPAAILDKYGGFATGQELTKEGLNEQALETAVREGRVIGAPDPEGKLTIYGLPGTVRSDLQGKQLSWALHARLRKRVVK